jgi:hypothetical protein
MASVFVVIEIGLSGLLVDNLPIGRQAPTAAALQENPHVQRNLKLGVTTLQANNSFGFFH